MGIDTTLESSPSMDLENQDATLQAEGQEDAAPPSSAKDEKGAEKDLLSVVRDAIQPAESNEAKADSSTVEEVSDTDSDEGDSDAEAKADSKEDAKDYANLPFNTHPRFKQLIRERNELRTRAQEFDRINQFMSRFEIQPDETANAFKIMALAKTDPARALEELKAIAHVLAVQAGEVLPEDLSEKVENGYLDRDAALELSRTRSKAQLEAARRQQLEQRFEFEQESRQVSSMADAVTAWEDQIRRSDVDYDLKADMIDDRVRALVAERGRPRNSDEALSLAQEAYDTVSKRLQSVRPNKTPVRSVVGGKVGGAPQAEPKSVLDVIRQSRVAGV